MTEEEIAGRKTWKEQIERLKYIVSYLDTTPYNPGVRKMSTT